jgi:transcriptional regulator with XRE-family HTH domain
MIYIHQNIKYLRKQLKISQSVLADKLELSRSNIAAYEIGNAEPNLTKLIKLATFFKIAIDDLISTDLSQNTPNIVANNSNVLILNNSNFQKFETETAEVKNAISGLKQFFKFRTKNYSDTSPEVRSVINDFENILSVSEHLVDINEALIESLKNTP